MTGLSIMGLLPPGGSIVNGSIKLAGRELTSLPDDELRAIRGNEIAMIFQDPLTSLDPTKTIGYQVAEPVRLHRGASKKEALDRAAEVLALVGLPRPKERLADYPHQLSGGLRQRVMIAMALSCEPKPLIADEPTTALDVTIQAQILALLDELKSRLGMAMLLITHDMGVIAGHADRVNVMYAGRLVEESETIRLFEHMHHPYTQALLASIPRLDQQQSQRLANIPGLPPDLANPPQGCRFAVRCSRASDKCRTDEPPLAGQTLEHRFACWHPVDGPLVLSLANGAPAATVTATDRPVAAARQHRPASRALTPSPPAGGRRPAAGGAGAGQGVPGHRRGDLAAPGGQCARRVRCLVYGAGRPDLRPGGRVRLRQDDHRPGRGRAGAAQQRQRPAQRPERLGHARRRTAPQAPRPAADVPGPVLLAGPADAGRRIVREPMSIQGLGSRSEQQKRVFELLDEVGCRATPWSATRTSSPAAAAGRSPADLRGDLA
jgi:peptide/nickel transport system ATP-binding protein